MESGKNTQEEDVEVSISMSGSYESVLSKLESGAERPAELKSFIVDVSLLLETVRRTGGGTRSVIAEDLPPETTVDFDAEAVSTTLGILERYDLVTLEGNTWKPGPELPSNSK